MIEIFLMIIGIILLIKGAEFLVDGSSSIAKHLGVSSIVIGLTVVALGTSLPELFVNLFAAVDNQPDISLGNIIGSNMANILLILGISILIFGTIQIKRYTVKYELPLAIAVVMIFIILSGILFFNIGIITRLNGIILLFVLGLFVSYIYVVHVRKDVEKKSVDIKLHSTLTSTIIILFGCAALYLGGKWTVEGAIYLARQFGLSEFLISATIIAVGTSLPEFATSIVAIRKKQIDISVGNIIGSNIINICLIIGITALINPIRVEKYLLMDFLVLLASTVFVYLLVLTDKNREFKRWHGGLLVTGYIVYIVFLIIRN